MRRPAKLRNVVAGFLLFGLGFGTVAAFIDHAIKDPPSSAEMTMQTLAQWSIDWNRRTPRLPEGE